LLFFPFEGETGPVEKMTMPTLTMQRAHDEAMGSDGPMMPGKPVRRIFTAEYKMAIIAEYEACTGTGEKGALLRREGLYSSHLVEWRKARDAGALGGLSAQPRRRRKPSQSATAPSSTGTSDGAALAKANRRIGRLEADLARARLVIDIQGKAHALLELLAESADTEPKPKP
jgi:transposase